LTKLRGLQCDPLLWQNFSYERTSKTSKFRDLLRYNFVSSSVPAHCTNRDAVRQIAREFHIPIESLPDDLNQPLLLRGQSIFGFAGDEIDKIAEDYVNMQWWLSDVGLNMAIVTPAKPVSISTFDELFGLGRRKANKPAKRNQRYRAIDKALQMIAESRPSTQEEVFRVLDGRGVAIPPAEPFASARGWMSGFGRDEAAARAWLSKRWHKLTLASLTRGPKK
jgi:hypothetical protein